MAKKGISTWSNTAPDAGFPSIKCLKDLNECNVEFIRHKDKGKPEIAQVADTDRGSCPVFNRH